jgi:hypothetical protein
MTQQTIYQNNDQWIEIDGLQDPISGNYLNAATVQATIVDKNNLLKEGAGYQVAQVSLAYLTGSNGNYRGKLAQFVVATLPVGGYTLMIDASQTGVALHLEVPAVCATRTS